MPKIKILDAGYVGALKMYAPIVNPIIVPASSIHGILREGHKVVEYNDRGKGVVLTLSNFANPNRFDEPKTEEPANTVTDAPVENPYGKDVAIDTEAPVFTGYTKNSVIEFDPPKAKVAADAATVTPVVEEAPVADTVAEPAPEVRLTKAQKKALAKAKREEEAAKAASTEVIE